MEDEQVGYFGVCICASDILRADAYITGRERLTNMSYVSPNRDYYMGTMGIFHYLNCLYSYKFNFLRTKMVM